MAVAVREKLGQPGVRFENWEFEMKALLKQHGLGAVVRAPVGLEGNSRLGSVSAAAASPARPVGVATPAISPAAAVAAAATAAVAASLTPEQDEKAHAIICSSVDPTKYRALCNRHESARALWQALRNIHTQQVHASPQQLIIQAGRQSMQSGQSVQEYWAEAQDLHERINSTGAYSDTLCQALLGLPPDYQQLVQSILEQPLDEQLTFEQILPRLLLREQLLQNSQPHAVALAARSARGRDSSSPSRHPGSMSRSSIAYSVVSKPLLFGEWVIDSGCSRHLTPHRELLHDYQPLHEPHHIIVANGGRIEAQGQGVVCFEGAGGAMQLLDVLHVPEADGSLVSVGKATRAGGSVHFTPFGCSINMPGAEHSIRGTQVEQDLFLLDSKPVPVAGGFSLAARTCSDPLVLHHRLGHPGYRQLARLLREGMVRGTSQTSLEARQHAGLGVTATRPLMLVHNDVCDVTGQYSAATPDGMRYFVSLLDEFSGLVAVVLIKRKSEAPAALRDMVTLLQRRLGHKVVYLRTDRGGEYIGAETQQWLRSEGITHQQTAPRTPTMNGSAERVNRTIMECVRAMMLASGVPASFWGFGVMAAAHVHNVRPVAGKPCTPHEACFGSPPDIHHLRVWGCPAWVHDSEPSSKLASRGIKGELWGCCHEAMSRPDAEEWGRAMDAEMASQHANQTWVLVSRQPGMSVLPGRWVLKVKRGSEGSIVKYKARWVVKGFRQRDGVDYFEDAVFAPVVMHTTQRLIFALAVQRGWGLWQIDFKTAFLNSKLTDSDPQIFVEQPEGYEVGRGLVCQLQRTVYGLKHAPRAWYMCLREQLEQIGFRASAADPNLFSLRTSSGSAVHMLVYVDDCILASADEAAVQEVKQQLQQAFDVHDLGQAADFLGMRIAFDRAAGILRLTQQQYIEQLLQRFGLAECNPRQLPLSPGTQLVKEGEQLSEQHTLRYRELVGGLLWLSTCTRPDIAFAVGQLTRYMQAPTREHEQAAQGVLRDYASCKQSRRSTTGYVFILSGATVSVRSKLQTTVATSTTEAEYQAAADATREALFLRKLLHELCAVTGPVPILCDSQGAVALVKNPVESQRSKHIAVMHHMARERVWRGEVEFSYCPTADMVADALTKALPGPKFVSCKAGMGVG
ncbi:hypothetical protein QJQ45_004352 [Haematococcus lacustris]|nr:hypothetical protein QJQ45_004352 [Haematococcus lacustris]